MEMLFEFQTFVKLAKAVLDLLILIILMLTMTNQNPVQNRVEEGLPPSLPPPCSQIPPSSSPIPPGDQTNAQIVNSDESIFFKNLNYKKCYFSTYKVINKVVKSESRIWFLQNCINLKIVPNNSSLRFI